MLYISRYHSLYLLYIYSHALISYFLLLMLYKYHHYSEQVEWVTQYYTIIYEYAIYVKIEKSKKKNQMHSPLYTNTYRAEWERYNIAIKKNEQNKYDYMTC